MSSNSPIVVIGAGTAGCTVVSYLAGHTDAEIVLIDPGSYADTDDFSGFHDVLSRDEYIHHNNVLLPNGEIFDYLNSRVIGGGSAVNGMLLTGKVPPHLTGLTRRATRNDVGPIGEVLLQQGGELSHLWWNGGRWNPGRAVRHLEEEGRICRVRDSVQSILWSENGVKGVQGGAIDIDTSHVIMCAGAIQTPIVLLQSGCLALNPHIGRGLQNHPSLSVRVERTSVAHTEFDASVIRRFEQDSNQFMMFAFERASAHEARVGVVSVALMSPSSVGSVSIRDGDVIVDFNVLGNSADIEAMTFGVQTLAEFVTRGHVESQQWKVLPLATGDSVEAFAALSSSQRQDWLIRNSEMLFHATSSCSQAVDETGQLGGLDGLWIADASVLPRVPIETPAGPVTMEARRIAKLVGKQFI